ncbi:thioredoxin family protein [Hathewaya proteolytica]|nr:thioredoxin family protein [Hathewaya proteolytica]
MDIKVIGAGCPDCNKLYENTMEAIKELSLENVTVTKVEDLVEIVKLGVMTAPSLLIDGKLVISGQAASTKKVIEVMKKSGVV